MYGDSVDRRVCKEEELTQQMVSELQCTQNIPKVKRVFREGPP